MWSQRREAFLTDLEAGHAVAVIPTSREAVRNGDSHFRFRPDSSFYYLTGFGEPEAVAVFAPSRARERYVLFVRPRDPEMETWTGRRAGVEGARERFGADVAYPIAELEARLPELLKDASTLYYPLGRDEELDRQVQAAVATARRFRRQGVITPSTLADPGELLAERRLIKSPEEMALLARAAEISVEAHMAAMAATAPGVMEYEIEALIEYTFRRNGASAPAYTTIVGGGANGTILHYVENRDCLRAGELLLVDAGAELDYYCSDVTRTWPIDGRFTAVQRDVYDVVLAAEKAAIDTVRVGRRFSDPHEVAVRILTQGMVDLGLLRGEVDGLIETGAFRRFYMHRTGHWLGMDVHDVGEYFEGPHRSPRFSRSLAPGMLTTVEPGIYISEADETVPEAFRGIGIRIEDDVLVTDGAPRVLTERCPKEPEALEALVGSDRAERRHALAS